MGDASALYQETILDHSRAPRNFRVLEHATHSAEGFNPLCGDKVTLQLSLEGDRVADLAFQGSGCAISRASASLMTAMLKGKTLDEAAALLDRFHDLVTRGPDAEVEPEAYGRLAVFAGVARFPARVKCATLAWHTFKAALENRHEPVTTEA